MRARAGWPRSVRRASRSRWAAGSAWRAFWPASRCCRRSGVTARPPSPSRSTTRRPPRSRGQGAPKPRGAETARAVSLGVLSLTHFPPAGTLRVGAARMKTPQDLDDQLVVDSTPVLVFSARPDGRIDYFNRRWLDYLGGVPLQSLEGSGWKDRIHPDDLEEHVRRWETALADGKPAVSEARVRNAKGEYRWMLHRTEALRDQNGNIIRWFGSSIDIEELKRAQHELQDLKDQLFKENIALRD